MPPMLRKARLREVGRLCTDALKLAARRKLRGVDRELLAKVLADGGTDEHD